MLENYHFLQVKVWRIHLFTIIQLICLTTIYLVKMFKQTSLAFPFVLILFVFLRQFVIPKIFTENEIKAVILFFSLNLFKKLVFH